MEESAILLMSERQRLADNGNSSESFVWCPWWLAGLSWINAKLELFHS